MTKDGLVFEVAGIVSVLVSVTGSAKRLYLATAGLLYPNSCFRGRAGFSDLKPPDRGWSQNPIKTVLRLVGKTAIKKI